ncbi:MAG: hypothetical protein HY518_00755 [Candidatus Aenigmarchaeota archaeon]|nr:hypothetical protein [Candidatus Aenigmarchaeota archaeon]
MKGVSPLIATVILIAIIFSAAALIGPYMLNLSTRSANQTLSDAEREIRCRNAAYDFSTDFGIGNSGVEWNFADPTDYLRASIRNAGAVELHDFALEILLDTATGPDIMQLDVTAATQRTGENVLKPGQSAILEADITSDITGTLKKVSITNWLKCKTVSREF